MPTDQWDDWIAAGQSPPDIRDLKDEHRLHAQETAATVHQADTLQAQMQRLMIWANVDDSALAQAEQLGAEWTHLLSADRGVWRVDDDPAVLPDDVFHERVANVAKRLRKNNSAVRSWCDCRPAGEGTPAQAAIDLAAAVGLDGWDGQAETVLELFNSVGITPDGFLAAPQGSERAQRIIANPNAWTDAQRATAIKMIDAGDLAVAGEIYCIDPGYSAQGVPIASGVYGVAMDNNVYIPLTEYLAKMPKAYESTFGVWHASGLQEEAWKAIESIA